MLMSKKSFADDFDNTRKFTTSLDTIEGMLNEYEEAGKSTNALKALAEKV